MFTTYETSLLFISSNIQDLVRIESSPFVRTRHTAIKGMNLYVILIKQIINAYNN